MDESTLEVLT